MNIIIGFPGDESTLLTFTLLGWYGESLLFRGSYLSTNLLLLFIYFLDFYYLIIGLITFVNRIHFSLLIIYYPVTIICLRFH